MFDALSNFGYGTVSSAPSPGTSGTVVVLGTSTFDQFPSPATESAYDCVVWPAGTIPLFSNAEIVRVVSKGSAGTINITRQQQSTSARDIQVGDQFALAVTRKTVDDVHDSIDTGWVPFPWSLSFGSGTTVTIVGDYTANFNKGTRVKLTQGGTVRYYLTANSSASSGTTTVTVVGDAGTTVANSAISNVFYSYEVNPQGFPHYFNWQPVFTGFSVSPGTNGANKYTVVGNTCFLVRDSNNSDGTSDATSFTMTLPVPSAVSASELIFVKDNGANVTTPGHILFSASSGTASLFKTFYNGSWTSSAGKNAFFSVTYPI